MHLPSTNTNPKKLNDSKYQAIQQLRSRPRRRGTLGRPRGLSLGGVRIQPRHSGYLRLYEALQGINPPHNVGTMGSVDILGATSKKRGKSRAARVRILRSGFGHEESAGKHTGHKNVCSKPSWVRRCFVRPISGRGHLALTSFCIRRVLNARSIPAKLYLVSSISNG